MDSTLDLTNKTVVLLGKAGSGKTNYIARFLKGKDASNIIVLDFNKDPMYKYLHETFHIQLINDMALFPNIGELDKNKSYVIVVEDYTLLNDNTHSKKFMELVARKNEYNITLIITIQSYKALPSFIEQSDSFVLIKI